MGPRYSSILGNSCCKVLYYNGFIVPGRGRHCLRVHRRDGAAPWVCTEEQSGASQDGGGGEAYMEIITPTSYAQGRSRSLPHSPPHPLSDPMRFLTRIPPLRCALSPSSFPLGPESLDHAACACDQKLGSPRSNCGRQRITSRIVTSVMMTMKISGQELPSHHVSILPAFAASSVHHSTRGTNPLHAPRRDPIRPLASPLRDRQLFF